MPWNDSERHPAATSLLRLALQNLAKTEGKWSIMRSTSTKIGLCAPHARFPGASYKRTGQATAATGQRQRDSHFKAHGTLAAIAIATGCFLATSGSNCNVQQNPTLPQPQPPEKCVSENCENYHEVYPSVSVVPQCRFRFFGGPSGSGEGGTGRGTEARGVPLPLARPTISHTSAAAAASASL